MWNQTKSHPENIGVTIQKMEIAVQTIRENEFVLTKDDFYNLADSGIGASKTDIKIFNHLISGYLRGAIILLIASIVILFVAIKIRNAEKSA